VCFRGRKIDDLFQGGEGCKHRGEAGQPADKNIKTSGLQQRLGEFESQKRAEKGQGGKNGAKRSNMGKKEHYRTWKGGGGRALKTWEKHC